MEKIYYILKLCRLSFYSSEIFSYEIEEIVEVFFKPFDPPKTKEESKIDNNDEVCLEEQIPEENIKLELSPIQNMNESMPKFGSNEKKMNERIFLDDDKMQEKFDMEENMDMTSKMNFPTIKKPSYQVENLRLIQLLFSYFEKKTELINPTSAGYFSKLINSLLNKKFDNVSIFILKTNRFKMMYYIEKNPMAIENIFKFLHLSSVSDFVSRLIRLDNPNLLDEYNKPSPLFLVKLISNYFSQNIGI